MRIERLHPNVENICDLVRFCHGFFEHTPYRNRVAWDPEAVAEMIVETAIQGNPLWVARSSDDAIAGALFGNTLPLWFNPAYTVWEELVFFVSSDVSPQQRGFVAKRLAKTAIEWCRNGGANFIWFASVMPGTSRLLKALGLKRTEEFFLG